ncbi:uncharacterized protein LOC126552705 [Aphis gossypii]|uniref:uncharacterized protein LOC126552705 n=1 Tax=Aphis gossypii TaxID=80765 RepID=UPI00215949EB|nr:uncharacterized protein LOC126552705 [Aphis gossypii]
MMCEAHCLPLNIRQKYLITKFAAKKMSTPQTGLIKTISEPYHEHLLKPLYIKLHDILEEISFNISNIKPKETFPTIPPWNMNHIEASTELTKFNKNNTPHSLIINAFYEIINTKFKNYYHFYTDASKTTNETGFAITHRDENSLHKLDPLFSIYSAETFAILEATLTALYSNHVKILILSDSMSAVTSIANVHSKCDHAQSIQNIILSTDKFIKLMWVPSHIGIPGNELVDELTMKAASSPDIKIYPHVTYDDVIRALKTKFYTLWQNQWQKQSNQNNKLRQIKPLIKKWPDSPAKLT